MNEAVLEAIIRKFRGPGWTPSGRPDRSREVAEVRTVSNNAADNVTESASEKKEQVEPQVQSEQCKPHIDGSGNLVIPALGPEKYHWWSGGQTIEQTLIELNANEETLKKYVNQQGVKS
jgi:hypothetical protein